MQKKLLKPEFIIITHKYATGVDDDIVAYLKESFTVLHVMHEFSSLKTRRSILVYYENGIELFQIKYTNKLFNNKYVVYIKEMFLNLYIIYRYTKKSTQVICCDGLTTLFSLIARNIIQRKIKIIFWSIDFVPRGRFENKLINFIYKKIDYFSCVKCDEKWDLSERMSEGRLIEYGISKKNYKNFKIVPYCIWVDKSLYVDYCNSDKNVIVYMGHISSNSGIELVIELMTIIENIKLKIIGNGPHLNRIKEYALKKNVINRCTFMGKIDNYEYLKKEIAKSLVAIAIYLKKESVFTYYADPGKIKTYLGCGIPVITTDIPWNASEIEKKGCGYIIEENVDSLRNALFKIIKNNQELRINARLYSQSFNCREIYSKSIN